MPTGIYIRTKPPWNKGLPCQEITKKKIGKKNKGKHYSPKTEFKKGNTPYNKGKICPEISERQKRERNHNWGKHSTEKTRMKMSEAHKGEKAPNWKGGITPENLKIRGRIELRLWREAVFTRDNWICQKCQIRSGMGKAVILHSHHVKNFAQYPELRFAINNGITLCKNCHMEFHNKYGRENNNEKQLEEFLNETKL